LRIDAFFANEWLIKKCQRSEEEEEEEEALSDRLSLNCLRSRTRTMSTCIFYFVSKKFGLGGLEVECWPLEPKIRGFKPGQSLRIFFWAKKSSARPPFGREVKLWVPCRRFTACKRSPECYMDVGHLQAKFACHFSRHIVLHLAARISRKTTSGECWKAS